MKPSAFSVAATSAFCALAFFTGCGGSPSSAPSAPPAPAVSSISPVSVAAGSGALTLTVNGSGFVSSTVVQVGGVAEATTYVSSAEVTAVVPAAQIASGGTLQVAVSNSGTTATGPTLTVDNPLPTLTQIAPSAVGAGSAATTITLTGTNFVPSTSIQINGSSRPTTYVGATQVSAVLAAADLATGGIPAITAVNPAPGGGTSAALGLTVNNPAPGVIGVSPAVVITGTTTPTTITVGGSGFVSRSAVQVNGVGRATTYVSASQLTFQLTKADQAATANFTITVVTPAPGGGTSSLAYVSVEAATPTPVITSLSPTQILVGSGGTGLSVYGSNLTFSSVVLWNGTPLPSQCCYATGGQVFLGTTVPASLLTTVGPVSITVSSPTATPALSNALTLNVVNPPPPVLTSFSPTSAPFNTASSITVNGTYFTPNTTVTCNGVAVPTSVSGLDYGGNYTLTAQLPAACTATPGLYPIAVETPAPGGGTSSPLSLTAYVPIENNSMVYNPVNGLFYVSVPSSAGLPYGNSVVSVDPVTGAFGTPIPVGSEPDKLAITADGKYLWVSLDGAAAVRKVDLTAGTAGLQFPIGGAGNSVNTVAALAALPGASDSVVVSVFYGGYTDDTGVSLAIYDSGVARGSVISFQTYAPFPYALIVDGTKQEIYGPGDVDAGDYITYSYSGAGITTKSSTSSSLLYAAPNYDEAQLAGGRLYTDYGQVDDPESGALLGTFYSGGTAVAQGSVAVDTTLGKAFLVDNYSPGDGTAQVQAFDTTTFNATPDSPLAVSVPEFNPSYSYRGTSGLRLTRWGADGLAFRGGGGVVSLRGSLVKDLSTVNADLGVTLATSGNASTGNQVTYTATVTNAGPAAATGVSLNAFPPSTGVVTSATPSAGSCSITTEVSCNLGGLANGASATVSFTVLEEAIGPAVAMTVQVSASEDDPVTSNNQAVSTLDVTGGTYNLAPALSAISPAAIQSGSSDTTIALTGSGFSSASTVLLNGTALSTSYSSATSLTAVVPAASLAALGWATVSVSNPAPGGGTSSGLPLSVFSVLTLNANHILYDPYSRKVMASVGTGTAGVAGNSIVAITPETASIGAPVPLSGTPTNLALTSDGQILYAMIPDPANASIARFNMLTQQADFTVAGLQNSGYNYGLRDIATQPGTEDTIAVDEGEDLGIALYDFNTATKTATSRGAATGIYTGTCLVFPNASSLFATDLYASGSVLEQYSVTANGLVNGTYPPYIGSVLQDFNCYKLDGGILYAQAGGVADASVVPAQQLGVFEGMPFVTDYGAGVKDFIPDTSLGLSFYLTDASPNLYSAIFDSITAFDTHTFLPASVLALPFAAIEGTTGFTGVDVVRWGQDGLAVLSSGGHIYLVRGAAVVPQLLNTNSAATLTGISLPSATHGAGNTSLTLTGSGFVPGVAVLWNGSYRTTTITDATHLTVAIPASDLAQAGSAAITVVNPGAAASAPLTFTIN